ncbi:hypothetical protein EA457_03210 [Streptococcus dysgalactiae subsp. dysgalactiae]|uniref:Uncharacterized protein n=1 Tax=Streptococcus dysgalactiae subsp. dysgalactiae TaxID=99822 RepID=A0A9X7SFP3_STRDY|nr:hypothetical protein [Streptococcus dysgalactiae subsp. dysgalactiae]QGG97567.1 hypothetical protein EA459_02215 [Streptococcus dysgalactiae subsp. dysgalactiae]QGH01626.1 hypothetical protein EA457_03210 [Streptococcus dysgalactiae subsp. dysgalactiae]
MPRQLLLLCCFNFGKDEYSRIENRLFLKLQRYLLVTNYSLIESVTLNEPHYLKTNFKYYSFRFLSLLNIE